MQRDSNDRAEVEEEGRRGPGRRRRCGSFRCLSARLWKAEASVITANLTFDQGHRTHTDCWFSGFSKLQLLAAVL